MGREGRKGLPSSPRPLAPGEDGRGLVGTGPSRSLHRRRSNRTRCGFTWVLTEWVAGQRVARGIVDLLAAMTGAAIGERGSVVPLGLLSSLGSVGAEEEIPAVG